MLNGSLSRQCPTTEYPCSASPASIPAVPNRRVALQVPNHGVSLQCPTTEYPCSAQPPSIPSMPSRRVSLQCPTTEYPCSAQPPSIPAAVPKRKVSPILQETLHCLCNNGFRVGMLEIVLYMFYIYIWRVRRNTGLCFSVKARVFALF